MRRIRHPRRWLATPLVAATLLTALPASAHDGHTHRAAWDACAEQELGADCQWTGGNNAHYIGTCRRVSGQLMCVRNRPIQRGLPSVDDSAADGGHRHDHDHDHAHGHDHDHGHDAHDHGHAPHQSPTPPAGEALPRRSSAAAGTSPVGGEVLLAACAEVLEVMGGALRQVHARMGAIPAAPSPQHPHSHP